MKIIQKPDEMQRQSREIRCSGRRIGLVPTMGYLHEGHLSLVRLARERADVVVVSLFVNPTQFGPSEDFERYPRDPERDEALCRQEKVDVLFCPASSDMYFPEASVTVREDRLSRGLCGASRPTHFCGVCTVVAKLFHLCDPDVAVFGCKDAQQLRMIERMVRDLNFPVRILRGPIVRESDGLAMSSRNVRLSPESRRQAVCLYQALRRAQELVSGGERRVEVVRGEVVRILQQTPGVRIDYVELVDEETLEPVETLTKPVLAALAVFFGDVRLIDNETLVPQAATGGFFRSR
ncbi:MAG: pantoate--beta-alanine ligase [Kiritimatiellia bacterium]|nr:pantoate--beta-alanine ligase [Kiritimatiellia bacterium]